MSLRLLEANSDGFRKPGLPQPPVTLEVRQGTDGAQVVILWVTREVAAEEGLGPLHLPHRPERPMHLDVDTDIMGAAVVPLESFQIRYLDEADAVPPAADGGEAIDDWGVGGGDGF